MYEEKVNLNENIEVQRGFWLSALLAILALSSISGFSGYYGYIDEMAAYYAKSNYIIYALATMTFIRIFLPVGIWFWQKWAIYAFYAIEIIAAMINAYLGFEFLTLQSLLATVPVMALFFLTRNKWSKFS